VVSLALYGYLNVAIYFSLIKLSKHKTAQFSAVFKRMF